MKKTFSLTAPGHEPPRVVAAIKNDVRKYLRRERRKPLPEGVHYWAFNCKTGRPDTEPEVRRVGELIAAIDFAADQKWDAIYIEILATPGIRAHGANKAPDEDEQT